jgi:nucleoid DNA-binding protein
MYQVEIKNSCSCAVKRGLANVQEFDTKAEAEEEANNLLEMMQNEFCKKHRFELRNEFGNFNIYILAN